MIVRGGRVIGRATNRDRNDPRTVSDPASEAGVHAEIAALRSVGGDGDVSGSVLYVARVLKNGEPAMSKPCPECREAIRKAGVKKIVYTIENQIVFGERRKSL